MAWMVLHNGYKSDALHVWYGSSDQNRDYVKEYDKRHLTFHGIMKLNDSDTLSDVLVGIKYYAYGFTNPSATGPSASGTCTVISNDKDHPGQNTIDIKVV